MQSHLLAVSFQNLFPPQNLPTPLPLILRGMDSNHPMESNETHSVIISATHILGLGLVAIFNILDV